MEFLPAVLLALRPASWPTVRPPAHHPCRPRGGAGDGRHPGGPGGVGRVSVPAILMVAFSFGVARAISTPAARAMMPNLMPKDELAGAVAWSSTSWQVATIGGPAWAASSMSGHRWSSMAQRP